MLEELEDDDIMSKSLFFVYVNAKGKVSSQAIVNVAENSQYIQGVSIKDYDSGKLKTFRKDRILAESQSLEEAENQLSHIDVEKYIPQKTKPATFDIHFTGYKKDDKTRLENLATESGMVIRKSVTQELNLLCYGYNASAKKMTKARDMGIIILDEKQFIQFLETGEITDNL